MLIIVKGYQTIGTTHQCLTMNNNRDNKDRRRKKKAGLLEKTKSLRTYKMLYMTLASTDRAYARFLEK